jgi:iron(III) transport system substrate-binding protein
MKMGFKKNEFKRIPMILVMTLFPVILLLVGGSLKEAAGSERDSVAELIAGAKKEGKMVLYCAMSPQHSNMLLNKFQEKYPFIKTELYRGASLALINRIESEARANRYLADVIQTSGFQSHILKKDGLLRSYVSSESQAYEEGFKDPEGYWTSMYLIPYAMGYNTRLLSRKDIPDTYEGFLHPRWKEKIGFDVKEVEWFANMLKIVGEGKGLEFMKHFAAQNLQYRSGHTLIAQLIVAGEFPVGTVFPDSVEEKKKEGAPIEWVGVAPFIVKFGTTGVAAHASHPNTAKLFTDFSLSKEGQILIRSFGRVPARSDVKVEYIKALEGVKLYPSDLSLVGKYLEYDRQFKDIFKFS